MFPVVEQPNTTKTLQIKDRIVFVDQQDTGVKWPGIVVGIRHGKCDFTEKTHFPQKKLVHKNFPTHTMNTKSIFAQVTGKTPQEVKKHLQSKTNERKEALATVEKSIFQRHKAGLKYIIIHAASPFVWNYWEEQGFKIRIVWTIAKPECQTCISLNKVQTTCKTCGVSEPLWHISW